MSEENGNGGVSRRGFVKTTGAVSAGALAATALGATPAQAAVGTKTPGARALALIGDRAHNADYQRTHLNKFFGDLGMPYDYTINIEEFQDKQLVLDRLSQYKIFIGFRDGFTYPGGYIGPDAWPYTTSMMNTPPSGPSSTWVTTGFGQAIKEWVSQGGGLFVVHNNCHVGNNSQDYRDVCGGIYDGHPPVRPWKVIVKKGKKNHPLLNGVTDYYVTDEQHFTLYDGDPSHILLEGENTDGLTYKTNSGLTPARSVQAWAYNYGKGRVVHNGVGHNIDALWKPQTLAFWNNAIKWLQKEI